MNAVIAIGWAVALAVSVMAIFALVGMHGMVSFFPEGRRWWQLPAQLLSLALFAAVVLNHPFGA